MIWSYLFAKDICKGIVNLWILAIEKSLLRKHGREAHYPIIEAI